MDLSYSEALEELRQIVAQLQNRQTDLDELDLRLQRAQELVQFCQKRLRSTEDRLEGLFDQAPND